MGSRNRFKNRIAKTKDSNLSRKELIQKYGLSTFREDPVEQAALNKSKPSPDFSKDPKYASTGGPNEISLYDKKILLEVQEQNLELLPEDRILK